MRKLFWVVLVLLAGLSYFLVAPIAKDLGDCSDESTARLNGLSRKAEEEGWGKEQICQNGAAEFAAYKLCIGSVHAQWKVPEFTTSIILQISGAKRTIEEQVENHNNVCSEYPSTLIQFP